MRPFRRGCAALLGASVIECCYAANFTRPSSTMTRIVQRASTDLTFSHASKKIVDEKISLNVSRRLVTSGTRSFRL